MNTDPLLDNVIKLRARLAVAEGADERIVISRELWKAQDEVIDRDLAEYFAGEKPARPPLSETPLTPAAVVAEMIAFSGTHPLPPAVPVASKHFAPGGEYLP